MFVLKRILNSLLSLALYSPLAILLMAKAYLFGWPGRMISRKRLPAAGARLGLGHRPSDYRREFGELRGSFRGYSVVVQPEESMTARINVGVPRGPKGLMAELNRPRTRPGKKEVEFASGNRRFDRVFRTRRIHSSSLEVVVRNQALHEAALRFYDRWMFRIDSLRIEHDGIECRLKYGFLFFPHIPSWRLEDLVGGLVGIAETLGELKN